MIATEKWPEVSDDLAIQTFYEARREEGVAHSLAEMFAFQQPPLPKDDTVWLRGMNDLSKNLFEKAPDFIRQRYTEEALAAGDNISGAVYMPGLARHPGDREAWVHDRGEVQKRLEERGWGAQGDINVKARNDMEPTPDIDVADDLVENKVLDMLDANPELEVTPELVHEARDAIKPHWAK